MTPKYYQDRDEHPISVVTAYSSDGTCADTETLLASRFVCFQIIGDTAYVNQWVCNKELYLEHKKLNWGVKKIAFPVRGNEKLIEVIEKWQNGIFE